MYLCLNLHGLVLSQFLEANELYGIKSVYMNVPASKAKEKVIKFQSMELNNRIQRAH